MYQNIRILVSIQMANNEIGTIQDIKAISEICHQYNALLHVDASVQYPMVTGGVMIVSTIICFFGDRKPSKKEIISVLVAFVGMLALFVIPI